MSTRFLQTTATAAASTYKQFAFTFHVGVVEQTQSTSRPTDSDVSRAVWFDLVMVGVLYQLSIFSAVNFIISGPTAGFWPAVGIYFAFFDAWTQAPIFQTFFSLPRDDVVHSLFYLASWLLIALMASAVITIHYDPTSSWSLPECRLFAWLKFAHAAARLVELLDVVATSPSPVARASAKRLVACNAPSVFLYLASSIYASAVESVSSVVTVTPALWVGGYVLQRVLWAFISASVPMAQRVRGNVPYLERRLNEWIVLQLGACVLSLITTTRLDVDKPTEPIDAELIVAYIFFAALLLFSQFVREDDFSTHALNQSSWREYAWTELYVIIGLSIMVMAIATRAVALAPSLVPLPDEPPYLLLWVMSGCATVADVGLLLQERFHAGYRSEMEPGWWAKLVCSALNMVAPLIMYLATGITSNSVIITLSGCAGANLLLIVVHAISGGFQRRVRKTRSTTFAGHLMAAVVAKMWLEKARATIRAREEAAAAAAAVASAGDVPALPSPVASKSPPSSPALGPDLAPNSTSGPGTGPTPANGSAPTISGSINSLVELATNPLGAGLTYTGLGLSSLAAAGGQAFLSASTATNNAANAANAVANHASQTAIVISTVVNEHFYARPTGHTVGDAFTEFKVSWSDLFFDVLYEAVVFRVGGLLLYTFETCKHEFVDEKLPNVTSTTTTPTFSPTLPGNSGRLLLHFHDHGHDHGTSGRRNLAPAASPPSPTTINGTATTTTPYWSSPILVFGFTFAAVFALWQSKVSYSAIVGVNDVFHKLVDLLHGLCVVVAASSLASIYGSVKLPTYPTDVKPAVYVFIGALLAFHVIMLALWIEVYTGLEKSARLTTHVIGNMRRVVLSILPLVGSAIALHYDVRVLPLSALWLASWVLPLLERGASRFLNMNRAPPVPALHGYVAHRLGDALLIMLGEGVLQTIRTVSDTTAEHYVAYTASFFILALVRELYFTQEAFHHPKKSADARSRGGSLALHFLRTASYPGVVAIGVACEMLVVNAAYAFKPCATSSYWLITGSSAMSLVCALLIYQTHRFAHLRSVLWRNMGPMLACAAAFFLWPWIPMPSYAVLILVCVVWAVALLVQNATDDFMWFVTESAVMTASKLGSVGTFGSMRGFNAPPGGAVDKGDRPRLRRGGSTRIMALDRAEYGWNVEATVSLDELVEEEERAAAAASAAPDGVAGEGAEGSVSGGMRSPRAALAAFQTKGGMSFRTRVGSNLASSGAGAGGAGAAPGASATAPPPSLAAMAAGFSTRRLGQASSSADAATSVAAAQRKRMMLRTLTEQKRAYASAGGVPGSRLGGPRGSNMRSSAGSVDGGDVEAGRVPASPASLEGVKEVPEAEAEAGTTTTTTGEKAGPAGAALSSPPHNHPDTDKLPAHAVSGVSATSATTNDADGSSPSSTGSRHVDGGASGAP